VTASAASASVNARRGGQGVDAGFGTDMTFGMRGMMGSWDDGRR